MLELIVEAPSNVDATEFVAEGHAPSLAAILAYLFIDSGGRVSLVDEERVIVLDTVFLADLLSSFTELLLRKPTWPAQLEVIVVEQGQDEALTVVLGADVASYTYVDRMHNISFHGQASREFLNRLLDLYSEVLGSVPSDRVDAADRSLHASLVSLVGASRFEQQR